MEIVSGEKMWEPLRDVRVLVQTGCFASLDATFTHGRYYLVFCNGRLQLQYSMNV